MSRLIDADGLIVIEFGEIKFVPKEFIDDAPTIEPERETGKWIEHHEPYTWMGYTFWSCSNCGFECGYDKEIRIKTNFCPNCGARMEGK